MRQTAKKKTAQAKTPGELIASGHPYILYVPEDSLVDGKGYRPSFVFEGVPGHVPNGTWPYNGRVGETCPWFWGFNYATACAIAREQNERLGISVEREAEILQSSLHAQFVGGKSPS